MPTNRLFIRSLLIVLLLLAAPTTETLEASPDGLAQESRPNSWKEDAALTDVYFLDHQRGWAVGSQGVLLRTEDGGKTWGEGSLTPTSRKVTKTSLAEKFRGIQAKRQMGAAASNNSSAPFSCRFESVCFTDAKNGWAAGGYDLPYLNHSRAVIARTTDGGKSWRSLPQLMIPRIHKIEFRGALQRLSGWAIGSSDPATDAALFFTSDAGNIWSSQKSKRMPDLIDAESTGNRFVGIDTSGKLATFDTRKFEYSVVTTDGDPILSDVVMDQKNGWAVGSDGTVLTSNNGGLSWSPASVDQALLATFDFRCVHLTGNKVWFAGDPGHVLFSLDRKNNELKAHPLPRGIGINQICFVDDDFGWAVGDFGKIYATTDGGEKWTMQRGGSWQGISQTGMLALSKDVSELPLELIARHAGEDGKLLGVAMLPTKNFDSIRLAAERVGASVVTPIHTNADPTKDDFLRKTVRTIRLWKPTIIVGAETRFIEQALRMAADENAYPQQLASGLNVWQAKFMIATDPNGPIEFDNDVFLARMGTLLEDIVLPSRMICGMPMSPTGNSAFFAWKFVGNGANARRSEVTKNPISQANLAKRKQNSIPLGSLSAVSKIGQKRQRMNALTNMPIESILDVEQCKRAIAEFTFGLNTDRTGSSLAGVWLMQLADKYVQAGQPQQAAWALEQLASSLPNHCFAPLASATLAKYYASSEQNQLAINQWQKLRSNIGQANRIPKGLKAGQQQVAIQKGRLEDGSTEYRWDKVDLASALEEAAAMPLNIDVDEELENFDPDTVDLTLDAEEPEIDQSTQVNMAPLNTIEIETFLKQRNRSAASHFSRLGQRDPGLVKRAGFKFLQAHIVKQLGGESDAEPYYRNVLKSKPHALFSPAASDETRADNQSLLTGVIAAAERPHLDGLPNDSVWTEVMKARQTIKLPKRDDSPMDDIAMVAWDREYVYVYARCYKSDRFSYATNSKSLRGRDTDLGNQDRVEIDFDVDRDLLSSWRISIDYRGRVHESCGQAKSWNPKMFVANHQDESVWSIECAIPIKDLADKVKAGDTWRVDVRRQKDEMPWGDGVFWGVDLPSAGSMMQYR